MARGLAALDGAGHLDRAAEQQQLLGERGLAGVGVRDDRERPPPTDLGSLIVHGGGCAQAGGAAACAQRELQHRGILAAADGLVVAAPHADLLEAERQVQADRGGVGGPHLEEGLGHAGRRGPLEEVSSMRRPTPRQRHRLVDAQVEDVRLTGAHAHDAIADDTGRSTRDHAADVADAQAVAKDALAPGKLVGARARSRRPRRRPSSLIGRISNLGGRSKQFRRGGHRLRRCFRAVVWNTLRANFRSSHALRLSAGVRSR